MIYMYLLIETIVESDVPTIGSHTSNSKDPFGKVIQVRLMGLDPS